MTKKRIFYGWWLVILQFIIGAFGGATMWFGFTAYFDPLIEEFGWSYTAISLGASLRGMEMGLGDIMVGFLVDRVGSRRIIFGGSVLIGIGFVMLSRINSLAMFYWSLAIIFTGATGISGVVFFSLVTRWFHRRLGLALGLGSTGVSVGAFAIPGVVYLLDAVGFRTVFLIFGIAAVVIGSVTAFFVRNRPEDIGLGYDGVPLVKVENIPEHSGGNASGAVTSTRDYTLREAIATPAFWVLTYIGLATIFSMMMLSTHVMPYLERIGYSRYAASVVAMMFPIMSIVGRLVIGGISDFVNYRFIVSLMIVAQIAGLALFYNAQLSFLLIPFAVLFGISSGGIVIIRPAILRNYYGSTHIGSLIGICSGLAIFGSLGGPLLAGWIFDTTGSYNFAWISGAILLLVGLPLIPMMKRPQTIRVSKNQLQ